MALSSKRLYYRKDDKSFPLVLYTSISDVDNPSMALQVEEQTLYLDSHTDPISHFKMRVNGVTVSPSYGYSVGDVGPAGGIVFYDKGSYSAGGSQTFEWRYLEAWIEDEPGEPVGEPYEGKYQWDPDPGSYEHTTSMAIGDGYENTYAIDDASHPAAYACATASHGGYNDWFLPTLATLQHIYDNDLVAMLDISTATNYWSSRESSTNGSSAWSLGFASGSHVSSTKDYWYRVRAVRRF